jgi:GDP-L-fucose synthase
MDKKSKIFVAGGTGMVGSALIRKLYKSGYTNIISNYYEKKPKINNDYSVTFFRLDLTRQVEVEEFFKEHKPEYVFLSAAKVGGILANNTYKAEFIYTNIQIASHIIHSSYLYGVRKLLNFGSSCIYPKYAPQPLKEEYLLSGQLEPTNEPYAIAKITAIKLCRFYNEQYGTNFISVMPTNLYGPNDNFDLKTSHVLPALIRKFHLAKLLRENNHLEIEKDILKHNPDFKNNIDNYLKENGITSEYVEIWGTGNPYREFLHVDDVADASLYLMKNFNYDDIGEFVNIGTGKDITIKHLASKIKDIVGFKGDIKWDPSKPDGTPRKLLDVSKISNLGWKHKIELDEGISITYKWYTNNYA